jgi:hypothetical protein
MGRQKHWQDFEAGQKKWTPIKWWWQRVARGYDDREIWDLNRVIVKFIAPRLSHYVEWQCEHGMRYPDDLDPGAWTVVLRKMALAFRHLDDLDGKMWNENEEEMVLEGLDLFGKYLLDLKS